MKRTIIIIILMVGIGLLIYPEVSNYINELNGSKAIQEFNDQIVEADTTELDGQRELAEQYNASLTGQNIKDPFVPNSGIVYQDNYDEILNFANHMMGYIEIPEIDVYLPIYHGVSDETLSKGVGHMSETAFPIGGVGNHSVLTGHTGLNRAKLFTDLTKLTEGDIFYIHILGETLAYQVNQIKIVEPDETSDLIPVQGEDYVTLITCTPYGVNSHRLLVRGTRVPYAEGQHAEEEAKQTVSGSDGAMLILCGASVALAVLAVIIIVLLIQSKKRKKKGNGGESRRHGRPES